MNFWNRRNKIEFFHNETSIIDNFPIIEAKNLKLRWVQQARKELENHVKRDTINVPGFTHILRCPGIFDLFNYGYVITLHKDIIIKITGDDLQWSSQVGETTDGQGAVNRAPLQISILSDIFDNKLIQTPPWSADSVFKIDTGWHVIAPKGVKFLQLPIAYPDTFDFTSTMGILNPAIGTGVNFPVFWNGKDKDKETLIKSGTPLGHLIPLSEKKYQMVQRIMNQRDRDWLIKSSSILNSTFWQHTIRNKMANMYNKYWNGNTTKKH